MLKTVAAQAGATGTLTYVGTWNASANSPTLTSGVGTLNNYYVVNVAGSTNLDGITDWQVGDWAIFNGTVWQKIDQTNTVTSVNGQVGAVVLTVSNIAGAVANTVNVLAGTGMSGGGALTGNVTLNLANTAVTSGTYGNASTVSQVTIDAQGRVTNAVNVAISIASGNVTGLGTMATQNANNVTITGGTENAVTYTNVSISSGNATLTKVTASTVVATANTAPSSNIGAIQVGANSFNDTGVLANFQSNIAGYNQVTVQNTSTANNASAEFIAYNNLGTASTNFATVGINSSNYAGTGSINAPGYGYFLSGSTDMVLGTVGNNAIHFVANSAATDAMVVNSNNTVTLQSIAQSTSSSATFATSSLPLVPAGYIIINNNGTNVKIPYYAV
jgi:hypothetical protein